MGRAGQDPTPADLQTSGREEERAHRLEHVADDIEVLTVPPERFKSKQTHRIPLTLDALKIVDRLPRFARGEFMFTTTFGKKAIDGFSKAKERLDALMLAELCRSRKRPATIPSRSR